MQLEELLEAEGLDAAAARRTLEWARVRAAQIVAAMPAGQELGALLEGLPAFGAGAPARGDGARGGRASRETAAPAVELDDSSSIDIAADVEAGVDELGLPPPPDLHQTPGDVPAMLAGVPDAGSLEAIHSGEIEMLDADELELVDEGEELDEEESTVTGRSVESGAPEPVDRGDDAPVEAPPGREHGAPAAPVEGDVSVDLDVDLSDLDDL